MGFLWQVTKKFKAADGWVLSEDYGENSPIGIGDTSAPDICGQETGNSGGLGGPTAYFYVCDKYTGYEGGGDSVCRGGGRRQRRSR